MEHQAQITLAMICVIMTAPKIEVNLSKHNLPNIFLHQYQNSEYKYL